MRTHISSLQEQVDNLYANLNNLREQQDTYNSVEPAYSQDGSRSLSMSAPNSRTLPPLRRTTHQKSIPQFHGPTSSAYGFDVAKSSLKTMGINQEPGQDGGPQLEDTAPPTPAPMISDRDLPSHPGKDPIWSIDQAHAIRLARMYEEECGLMYPLLDIEYVVSHIKLLYTYIEAALRTGFTQLHLPGAQAIEDDDTNCVKMIIATGLVLEGHGQSDTAQAIYESMRPAMGAVITGATNMKGIILLVLIASLLLYC